MRLRKIKLSGFKSFVDPTTLIVPGNLVGVVGPNGCGKSNIIDAVMWVMGESSAKHLRGDALTDVIFNGSSARNPVGQASVELIFDNSQRKLGGQYASYDEISIKRQITRESVSTYFLNGTRCRRRDITAIFLGTGLGPRSYAIIEQGMISRLIEARPEELRTFIEEAAGISKYRERRRETENRIRNTRENIARLNDIREELGKQLKHLQRQANAAEKYQVLKKEQRKLDAELQALNWKALKAQSDKEELQVRQYENQVESAVAKLREIENTIVQERESLSSANESFNEAQSDYYRVGSDISQVEQTIHHTREKIADTEQESERVNRELQHAQEELAQDEQKLRDLESTHAGLEPRLQGSREESDRAYTLLNESEQAVQAWQSEWEAYNKSAAEYARRLDVGMTRLEHLEAGIGELNGRRNSLQEELENIDRKALQEQIGELSGEVEVATQQHADASRNIEEKRRELQSLRKQNLLINQELNERRLAVQKQEGRLASLEALQHSALGEDQEDSGHFIKQAGLEKMPRLAQQINVDSDWSNAVEIVLAHHLQDICVDDDSGYLDAIAALESGHLGLVASQKPVDDTGTGRFPSLADRVDGYFPLRHLLSNVYIAEDYAAALQMRANLSASESVITADGYWVGANWVSIHRATDEQSGILRREQEIQDLKHNLDDAREQLSILERQAAKAQEDQEQAEDSLNQQQSLLNERQEQLSELRASLAAVETQLEQADSRAERIREELEVLQNQEDDDNAEMRNIRSEVERIEEQQEEVQKQREELETIRDKHRNALMQAREQWQATHEKSHGIALQLESISSQRASLEQSIKRSQMQISHLTTRAKDLSTMLADNQSPLEGLQSRLEEKLAEKVNAEKYLSEARKKVQETETRLRDMEQARQQQETRVQEIRELLEKARLVTQESRVRCQTIEEKLKESGLVLEEILANLEEDATQSVWREQLDRVTQKIQRLGPINLAAIEEFNQLSERKTYLDKQDQDLNNALDTLENAIRKIDKESRARFRETFDQLNSNLQETFPQLFGGGNAYLELTGEDLLETGVTVMARPPGKRNSTIHLLSGGEKALTAVALVFSIFKLNPAPFCILDEVDAPLDDANVSRFSELVAGMSEDVQFIFITHNKITMEIAHQLLGVTMHEAGVSRLVSVDVDEAVKMAATA